MATTAAAPSSNPTSKRNVHRRRKPVGQRRWIGEDEASDDDAGHSTVDLVNDDSLTEGSIASDERDATNDSDTSNVDEASPPILVDRKGSVGQGKGHGSKHGNGHSNRNGQGIGIMDDPGARRPTSAADNTPSAAQKTSAAAVAPRSESTPPSQQQAASTPTAKPSQPAIVSSSSAQPLQRRETAYDKQRREHDLYRQRRDEDPSFVPNRGAFFMHDHRGAGPSANGFRPFGRPVRGGGRGRSGFGGTFSPMPNQFQSQTDPTVNAPWAHDMHDTIAQTNASRATGPPRRQNFDTRSQYGGSQANVPTTTIPTCPPSAIPINRSMSVEKQLGTVTVRVFFPPMKEPVFFERFKVMQYTKLPDHRPPLRRDKAVIIDLPGHARHQVFPAIDRSFIFIPRALRPNQQRSRGNRTRSVIGSISGFSRRTSAFGGSYYNGSMYSPSVALSRRSSIAQDAGRDFIISPTGSTISRPPLAMDNTTRPVVRLPPAANIPSQPSTMGMGFPMAGGPAILMAGPGPVPVSMPPPHPPHQLPYHPHPPHPSQASSYAPGPAPVSQQQPQPYTLPNQSGQYLQQGPSPSSSQPVTQATKSSQLAQSSQAHQPTESSSLSTVPPPQNHPLPQKPIFQENRPSHNLPMHQPRPQKTVSVETIESPVAVNTIQSQTHQPYAMPFHQQVPMQMGAGYQSTDSHSRHPSFHSRTTGTPLSQIPERAIHAAPFQPVRPGVPGQPAGYQQPNPSSTSSGPAFYGTPSGYTVMQPNPQQGYFYPTPPTYSSPMVPTAAVPMFGSANQRQQVPMPMYGQGDASLDAQHNVVTQEVNGMVYYINASQMPSNYSPYPQSAPQNGYMTGMSGMVTPAPTDGYYYGPQPVIYYTQ